MSENILTFLTLLVFMECSCFLPTDGRVYEAPSKVVYRSIGSDVVFTWCVSSTWLNRRPTVTFYLKNPVSRSVDERAIAKVSPTQVVEVLPNFSVHKSLFSRSQINVYVTNCTANRTGVQLTNYSLAISNLSMSQSRFYEIYVNYLFDIFGTENGARLNVVEPPSFVVKESRKMEKLEEGKSFSEVCRVISELPMNVTWFKGSQIKAAGVNSSTLAIDSLKRSDNGTYTCLATNELATIKRFVDLVDAYLDHNCTAQFEDGRIILKTSATGRPPVICHPRPCPSRIDLTAERNSSWVQVIENRLIRRSCTVTKAVYDARMKCPGDRSLELNFTWFSYSFRDDKNTMTFFSIVGGNTTVKGLLYVDEKLKNPDNTNFDIKLVGDTKAGNFLENACRLKGNGGQSTKLLGGAIAGIVVGVAILVIVIV